MGRPVFVGIGEALGLFLPVPEFDSVGLFVLEEQMQLAVEDLEVRRARLELLVEGQAKGASTAVGRDVLVRVLVDGLRRCCRWAVRSGDIWLPRGYHLRQLCKLTTLSADFSQSVMVSEAIAKKSAGNSDRLA